LAALVRGGAAQAAAPERPWTSLAFPPAFEHISVEHGLSQSTVHTIAQDKAGFLWLGTESGLNRYDGFRFLTFHPEKDNPRSLAGNWIEKIVPDRHGMLWVTARNAGLTLVDPESLSMVRIPSSDGSGGLPARIINAIVEDREGSIWIGTETDGLWRVDKAWTPPELPHFEKIVLPTDASGAPLRRIRSLLVDHTGTLWMATPELGLGRRVSGNNGGQGRFQYFLHDAGPPDRSCPTAVNSMAEDSFGKLWLGADEGLFIFDPASAGFEHWTSAQFKQGLGRVLDVLRDTKQTMWVAADGLGLFKALPRQQGKDAIHFQNFTHDPKDSSSLSRNGLQCVFEDSSGMLWVTAYQGGVNKLILHSGGTLDRERPSIYQYRNIAADPWSLSGDTIAAIGEDRFGNLWIGTDGFGLNRLAAPKVPGQPARFERFRKDHSGTPGSLQTDVILSTHLDPQKRL
jgi:ligand-binding sensor domain-containing protein